LSCDRVDADPIRFWVGFIEAPRAIEPNFGADAAELLAMDRKMSADVTACHKIRQRAGLGRVRRPS
jgi:LuxR family transcriptional regulator, maltose regulon positive regulatory protein